MKNWASIKSPGTTTIPAGGGGPQLSFYVNQASWKALPEAFRQAFEVATFELYEEEAKTNPDFAAIYRPWKQFRDTQFQWFKVAEAAYANFNYYVK